MCKMNDMKQYLFIFSMLIFAACKKENDAPQVVYSAWPVNKIEGATIGSVNQEIPITVSWPYSTGCDIVDKFHESPSANTVTVTTLGYTIKGPCTMDAGVKTSTYRFKATSAGTYTLKFVNNDAFICRS